MKNYSDIYIGAVRAIGGTLFLMFVTLAASGGNHRWQVRDRNITALSTTVKVGSFYGGKRNRRRLASTDLVKAVQVPISPSGEHVLFDESDQYKTAYVTNIVTKLLDQGANANIQDVDNKIPLIWAAATGRTKIIKLLLKHGARIDMHDKDGETALHWAVWEQKRKAVVMLLKYHANRLIRDKYGNTPLGLTSKVHHYPAYIKRLLKN